MQRKAHRGMLVTTGSFTGPARVQAEDYDIELVDGPTLASLIVRYSALVATLGLGPSTLREEPAPSPPTVPEPLPIFDQLLVRAFSLDVIEHILVAAAIISAEPVSTSLALTWRRWWRRVRGG
jgi:Restriction endonuclease